MNAKPSTPNCSTKRRATACKPSRSTCSNTSMPLKNTSTTAASSIARRVGRPSAASATINARPPQVHSGTAQCSASTPSHLAISPGTMK